MSTIKVKKLIIEVIAVLLALALFGVPFYFVIVNSGKDAASAARMTLSFPETSQYLDNFRQVITASNSMLIRAFFNSFIISAATIIVLIGIGSSAGFVLGRRKGKAVNIISFLVLAGLMVPPAIVPTIWLLRTLGLYKSLPWPHPRGVGYHVPLYAPSLPRLRYHDSERTRRGIPDRRDRTCKDVLPHHLPSHEGR